MDQNQIWTYVSLLSPIVLLLGISIGLYNFKHLGVSTRYLFYYLVLCLGADFLCRYFGYYSRFKYNLFIVPIFGFFELAIFSKLYYSHILRRRSNILIGFMVLALLCVSSELLFVSRLLHLKNFQSFGKVIADVVIVLYCLMYYWRIFNGSIPIVKEHRYLNVAALIYFSINLVLFLPINFLVNESISVVFLFWVLNLVSLNLFYLVLIYLIWQNGKIRKCLR
ncbi:hypothetical protein CLV25_11579 [Acetobacteroides hydrogenigenes]|uniref:YhhN-like protein n=1 Tax=Acetobacteroides hydrogenigenes TaxID=979970 RepID=A0A4R2EHV3_9BACT|nr:hypothetical protein CLV25_11579 [Acetobacteroides hydrogenigenes]